MKNLIFIFVLLISVTANAKFVEGIVKFNDGHEEKGLIKSFLEEKWFFAQTSKSLEENLNLDDKFLVFKINNESDTKKILIDEINQVTLINENNTVQIFKVIFLREVNKDGTISNEERKVYLPLLKEGRINIFGFKFLEKSVKGAIYSKDEIFYYQNSNESYAINYGNIDEFASEIIFESNMREKLSKRMGNPLKDLFKDCPDCKRACLQPPEIVNNIDTLLEPYIEQDRAYEAEEKRLSKEFKKLPKEKQNDLLTIHYYDFNFIDKLINDYQNCK